MNKFRAKVKFYDVENSAELIKAFFQEFNPLSILDLREKEAEMEIAFNNNPKLIIDAINKCKVIYFKYGDLGDEKKHTEVKSYKPQEEIVKEKKSVKKQIRHQNKKKQKQKKNDSVSEIGLGLDQIAEKASSFEDFVNQISNCLHFNKNEQLLFEKMAIASIYLDKLSWNKISSYIRSNGQTYSDYLRKELVKAYEENFKESDNTSIFQLFTLLKKYKDYQFNKTNDNKESKQSEIEDVEMQVKAQLAPKTEISGEAITKGKEELKRENADKVSKSKVELKCMPRVKELEKALETIDKTKPIEERITQVLLPMGLANLPWQEQQWILQIAKSTVVKKTIDLKKIVLTTGVPEDKKITARIKFSNLINSFSESYGGNKKITLTEFLTDLQRAIMDEDEFETV